MNSSSAEKVRVNQFGEKVVGDTKFTPDLWQEKWNKGQTKFHMPVVHPMLQKYYEVAFKNHSSMSRCFMPLCGKSLDLKWLAEKGLEVIGNEVVELGCRQFFEDNNIPYEKIPLNQIEGSIFMSKDSKLNISLYCCDFFLLTNDVLGRVDMIWDRGSLAAINVAERQRYQDVMIKLMNKSTSYLLDTFLVDNEIFAGPPNDIPVKELDELFGSSCTLAMLEERDAMTDWQRSWGLKQFTELVHLVKLKDT